MKLHVTNQFLKNKYLLPKKHEFLKNDFDL